VYHLALSFLFQPLFEGFGDHEVGQVTH
jgi:hypothetical protein